MENEIKYQFLFYDFIYPKSVIRKNFLSFLMTAIRKLALYKLDL